MITFANDFLILAACDHKFEDKTYHGKKRQKACHNQKEQSSKPYNLGNGFVCLSAAVSVVLLKGRTAHSGQSLPLGGTTSNRR